MILGTTGDQLAYLALRALAIVCLYAFIVWVVRVALRDLAALSEQTPARPAEQPTRLVVIDGGESGLAIGHDWALANPTTIGRRAGNTIPIDDPFLSGEHARITAEGGQWWVRDLGSTNGTLLNGVPVAAATAIEPGDIVQFGRIRMQALSDPSGAGSPPC